jgi:hypothetical protein
MLENTMVGILRAQNSIGLAAQNNSISSAFMREGALRVRQGLTSGNEFAVKEGEELQAKGEEMKADTYEFLGSAIGELNSDINIVSEDCEESCEETEASSESIKANPYINHKFMESGSFDVTA